MKKIGVISLGCDKNRVDTEKALAVLVKKHQLTNDIYNANVLIINTCAFLESARKEAVEEILSAIELKNSSVIEKIIVTGCLSQKFANEIFDELIEVDAFLGISDYQKLLEVIDDIYQGKRVNLVSSPKNEEFTDRVLTTKGYAYLKIADGCSNHCTYCLIPSIRGKYRSISPEKLIKEALSLGEVYELILVAQDVTKYGVDIDFNLVSLIKELSKLENIGSIRLLYCYPESITDELIEEIKTNDKVIKYIDIPMQHADDKVLKLMGRKGTLKSYLSLINKLKERIPNIAIRSTFITGFSGETEDAFTNLCEFLKKAKLFNVGFFKYSREEGTPSYKLPNKVPEREKNKRLKALYSVQKEISDEILSNYLNKTIEVRVEGYDDYKEMYFGRAYFNAPNIDGQVFFMTDKNVNFGDKVSVKVNGFEKYDLYGEIK
ncbi:MAG: 30S ribosomal protein S12 methylthiotransferase RimO [Clostridiales bacterium]|nr:30S ribosomal protein S12 methylthiotransferase RimO [Clostridiales bacterium]